MTTIENGNFINSLQSTPLPPVEKLGDGEIDAVDPDVVAAGYRYAPVIPRMLGVEPDAIKNLIESQRQDVIPPKTD